MCTRQSIYFESFIETTLTSDMLTNILLKEIHGKNIKVPVDVLDSVDEIIERLDKGMDFQFMANYQKMSDNNDALQVWFELDSCDYFVTPENMMVFDDGSWASTNLLFKILGLDKTDEVLISRMHKLVVSVTLDAIH